MFQFAHAIKVVCLSAVLTVSACGSLQPNNPDIDAATVNSGRIAMVTALSLTVIAFTVAATRLD